MTELFGTPSCPFTAEVREDLEFSVATLPSRKAIGPVHLGGEEIRSQHVHGHELGSCPARTHAWFTHISPEPSEPGLQSPSEWQLIPDPPEPPDEPPALEPELPLPLDPPALPLPELPPLEPPLPPLE